MDLATINNAKALSDEVALLNRRNKINGLELDDFIFNKFISRMDPVEYCQRILRAHLPESKKYLHSNQIELIRAACNPSIKKVAALMARQAGKTESIASMVGFLLDNYPNMKIGIFTPRQQQAEVNIGRLATFYQLNEEKLNNKIIKCNKGKIELSNGSSVAAVSASDQSNIEGLTFDIIILDEAQKISDYTWSERIAPMGGATNAKMIKIGTPKTRNHFYDCIDGKSSEKWKVFKRDWTECPQLWALDAIELPDYLDKSSGQIRKYSKYVLDLMPKALKQEYFPNNPEVWSDGEMSIEDFKTQYMLQFIDGAGKFLDSNQFKSLTNGNFDWIENGIIGEVYVAGIDFAGSDADNADNTHITVLRVCPNGEKHKVFGQEFHGIRYTDQINEIAKLFGGSRPIFNVKSIFADFTGCGRPVVQILQDEYGLTNLEGITFNASDTYTKSGMNMKNIMFSMFKSELDFNRIKYPSKEKFISSELKSAGKDNTGFYHKMVGEWSDLEFEFRYGVNKRISAPSGLHDDACCADVLANFAAMYGKKNRMPKASIARTNSWR